MNNKMMKIGLPAMLIAAGMFYFSALDQVKNGSVSSATNSKENVFNKKANPYVGVKLPTEGEEYVEVAPMADEELTNEDAKNEKVYFAPGSFDHKRADKQGVRNQRLAAKAMVRNELKIIEREIASDEIRVQELMQKGDSENANYLENLIAQKKARYDELRY